MSTRALMSLYSYGVPGGGGGGSLNVANAIAAYLVGGTSITTGSISSTTGSTFLVFTAGQDVTYNTPTDSKGNTYTQIGTGQTYGAGKLRVWICSNGTGGSGHTATVTTGSSIDASVFFVEVGSAAVSSNDSAAAAATYDTSSPFTVTSGTFAQANTMALVMCGTLSGGILDFVESTGFTQSLEQQDSNSYWACSLFYKVVAATTALTPSVTGSGLGDCAMSIIAIKG